MKIYDEGLYCQECETEISMQESLFNDNLCDDCYTAIHSTPIPDTTDFSLDYESEKYAYPFDCGYISLDEYGY